MLFDKYPVDSDFVESYLNYYLVKYSGKRDLRLIRDSFIYFSCVNLNPKALNLADCFDKKQNVDKFINNDAEAFNLIKNEATQNCKNELLEAYSLLNTLQKANHETPSEINFITIKQKEKELALSKCIANKLH